MEEPGACDQGRGQHAAGTQSVFTGQLMALPQGDTFLCVCMCTQSVFTGQLTALPQGDTFSCVCVCVCVCLFGCIRS